jgi:hypothetical protein
MLNLLNRIAQRLSPLPAGRMAVCPPLFVETQPAWMYGVSRWLGQPQRRETERCDRLAQVKHEFCLAVTEFKTLEAAELLERIALARTLLELWHLRADVYSLVAVHHNQVEAERRLAQLNRHYPTRSPRSGFTPLDA